MLFRVSSYPTPQFAVGRIAFTWIAKWRYKDIPWRVWLFAVAHDSGSYWWRIVGLEINWQRE